MVTIMKRGMNCHKSLAGVMSNARFGIIHIVDKDGIKHEVPQICLKKSGILKKNWRNLFAKVNGYAIPA